MHVESGLALSVASRPGRASSRPDARSQYVSLGSAPAAIRSLRWRSSVGEPSEFETPMHPINIAFRLFIVIELISERGKAVRGPSLGSGGMGEAPFNMPQPRCGWHWPRWPAKRQRSPISAGNWGVSRPLYRHEAGWSLREDEPKLLHGN